MTTKIFVFGSNLNGHHLGGSAAEAVLNYGAEWGNPIGLQGKSYAIPTLDKDFNKLPLDEINNYVSEFIFTALGLPEYTFDIVAIGCGIAGFKPKDIAPMFRGVPNNCILPAVFEDFLNLQEESEPDQTPYAMRKYWQQGEL